MKTASNQKDIFMNNEILLQKIGTVGFYQEAFVYIAKKIPCLSKIIIYLYDRPSGMLRLEHGFGFERNIKGLQLLHTTSGLCGKVFSSGVSELITTPDQIKGFSYETEFLTDLSHLDTGSIQSLPSSIMAVPIKTDGCIYGIMVLTSLSAQNTFVLGNLAEAEQYAAIAALHCQFETLASQNAHMQEELSLIENVLSRDQDMLLYGGVVSAAFSAVFLKGEEFLGMLELASSYTSYPIAVYNMFMERLCCTEEASNSRLPDNMMRMIELHQAEKQWHSEPLGDGTFLLIPIQYGGVTRGLLTVWNTEKPMLRKNKVILETLAFYTSLVWLKKAAVDENNKNLKSELLTGILSGDKDQSFLHKAEILGLEKSSKFFVILISVPNIQNHINYCEKQDGNGFQRRLEAILSSCSNGSIIVPEYNDICLIVSCTTMPCRTKRYDNLVSEIIDVISSERPEITISGSRVYETIYNVRKCYWEANQCMKIIQKYFTHRKSFNFIDMGALRLLLTQKREDIEAYLEDILGPIVDYDRERGSELIMTLFYYARFNKSVRYVSEKLSIHPNTLYQRIKKVEDLLGYNFENPMDWFDIQAASIIYGLMYRGFASKL